MNGGCAGRERTSHRTDTHHSPLLNIVIEVELSESRIPNIQMIADMVNVLRNIGTIGPISIIRMVEEVIDSVRSIDRIKGSVGFVATCGRARHDPTLCVIGV